MPDAPRPRLSLRKKVLFALLVPVLVLLGLEGGLRLLGYPRGLVRTFSKLWNPDAESRARLAGLFRPDFQGRVGYPPELAYDVSFNEQGLRGPPLDRRPRLLALGDSVTFGYHVDDAQAYPAQLQALLDQQGTKLQVLNGGCGSFTISDERRYLSERLLQLQPQAVVLQFCSNDVSSGELDRTPSRYEQILNDEGDVLSGLGQTALGEVLLRLRIAWKRWRKGAPESLGDPPPEIPEANWTRYEEGLRALRDELRGRGIPLVLISFPDLAVTEAQGPSVLDERLAQAAARLEIPFRSALDEFRKAEQPRSLYLYPLDPHPSAAGNAALARVALQLLDESGVLASLSSSSPSSSE